MENIIQKLHQIKENPGYFKGLTPEEQAELFIALLTPKKKILRKPVVITGIDGKTPEKDKDYLSKEASLAILDEIRAEMQRTLKGIKPEKGEKGKDAEITPELVESIVTQAVSRVPIPQFPYETIKTVTETQDALIATQEDLEDIKEDVEKLKKEPKVIYQEGGTIGKNQVYKFIAQAVADGTIPEGGEGGPATFTALTDTPSAYAGEGGKVVKVKGDESGLEFGAGGTGSGITRTIVVTTGDVTLGASADTDYAYLVNGAHTMTLPTAVGNKNQYTIKNVHTSDIIVNTTSSQTIDGTTSIQIAPEDSVDLVSNNTNWYVI